MPNPAQRVPESSDSIADGLIVSFLLATPLAFLGLYLYLGYLGLAGLIVPFVVCSFMGGVFIAKGFPRTGRGLAVGGAIFLILTTIGMHSLALMLSAMVA
jgi:hypothetical protein